MRIIDKLKNKLIKKRTNAVRSFSLSELADDIIDLDAVFALNLEDPKASIDIVNSLIFKLQSDYPVFNHDTFYISNCSPVQLYLALHDIYTCIESIFSIANTEFEKDFFSIRIINVIESEISSRRDNYLELHKKIPLSSYLILSPIIQGNKPVINTDYCIDTHSLDRFVSDLIERYSNNMLSSLIKESKDLSGFMRRHEAIDLIFDNELELKGNIPDFIELDVFLNDKLMISGESYLFLCVYDHFNKGLSKREIAERIICRVEKEKEYFNKIKLPSVQIPNLIASKLNQESLFKSHRKSMRGDDVMLTKSSMLTSFLDDILFKDSREKIYLTETESASNVRLIGSPGSGIEQMLISMSVNSLINNKAVVYITPNIEELHVISNMATIAGRSGDLYFFNAESEHDINRKVPDLLNTKPVLVFKYDTNSSLEDVSKNTNKIIELISRKSRQCEELSIFILESYFKESLDIDLNIMDELRYNNASLFFATKCFESFSFSDELESYFKTQILMKSFSVPNKIKLDSFSKKTLSELRAGEALVFRMNKEQCKSVGFMNFYSEQSLLNDSIVHKFIPGE